MEITKKRQLKKGQIDSSEEEEFMDYGSSGKISAKKKSPSKVNGSKAKAAQKVIGEEG